MTRMPRARLLAAAGIIHLTIATVLSLTFLAGRPVLVAGSGRGITPTFTPTPTGTPTVLPVTDTSTPPPSTETPIPPPPTETPAPPPPTETPTTPTPAATPVPSPPPPPPSRAPHLTITKVAGATQVPQDGYVTFTIWVCNDGDTTADNVVVSDALPPELEVVSASASQGKVAVEGNGVRAELGSLAPGACADVTIVARVRAGVPPGTQITNVAVADGQSSEVTVTVVEFLPEVGSATSEMVLVVAMLVLGMGLLVVGLVLGRRGT